MDETKEEMKKQIEESIPSGIAIASRHVALLEIRDPRVPQGTFAVGFIGENIHGEEKLYTVLLDLDGLEDLLNTSMMGIIYGRAAELVKQM